MLNPDLYPVHVRPLSAEEGGGFLATVPDLPGCMADGETEAEAMAEVREAIVAWCALAEENGDKIPEPKSYNPEDFSGKLLLRMPKSLHMHLSEMAKNEGVSINQLINMLLTQGYERKEDKKRVA